jgi:2-phosphosulfolactate phosphatase
MDVQILQLLDGAKQAQGLTVVIDVFRAFSMACYVMNNNAGKIITVGKMEEAYRLQRENPDFLLIGERNERKAPGFDFGNSPTHIQNYDFKGRTVVQTTSAGTQGIVNAFNASEIITGSFVNAGAIVSYCKLRNPSVVSLVCMGFSTLYPIEEDTFCAEYIKNTLEGKPTDFDAMVDILKKGSGSRLFDPANQEHSPSTDFYLCTRLSKFNFVLKAEKNEDGWFELRKINGQD